MYLKYILFHIEILMFISRYSKKPRKKCNNVTEEVNSVLTPIKQGGKEIQRFCNQEQKEKCIFVTPLLVTFFL